jgi:hypothetical protein
VLLPICEITIRNWNATDMHLTLYADSTFAGINIPDCITTETVEPAKGIAANGSGSLEIYQSGEFWKLRLEFKKGPVFSEKTFLDFDIRTNISSLIISGFVADPDSMNVLEFERANDLIKS